MGTSKEINIRQRMITNFEYLVNLNPSKLATYLRTKLAANQGCPPAPLLHIFTFCSTQQSCDGCWQAWLNSPHEEPKDLKIKRIEGKEICWNCRWGARSTTARPVVACMQQRFYGAIMDPEDFCSSFDVRPVPGPKKSDVEIALRIGELCAENQDEVGREIQKRYELKQLHREMELRRKAREELAEDKEEK